MSHFARLSAAVLCVTAALSSQAATYNFGAFPFSFMGATGVQASLTSTATGVFSSQSAIESFLNGSTYSAQLQGASGSLATLTNANSSWALSLGGTGAGASLNVGATGIAITFSTPDESSSAGLILRSADGSAVFQIRQENNVTDYAWVNFSKDAIFGATYFSGYGAAINLPAAPVSEPPVHLLAILGSVTLAGCLRRKRVAA